MLLRLLIADKALLIAAFLLLELCLQLRELSQALACFIQFLLLLSQLLQSMGIFQQSHALIALCGQLCLQRGKFFFLFLSCVIKLLALQLLLLQIMIFLFHRFLLREQGIQLLFFLFQSKSQGAALLLAFWLLPLQLLQLLR